jgi:hypothetical protein
MNKFLVVLSLLFLCGCSNSNSVVIEEARHMQADDLEVVRLISSKYGLPVSKIRIIVENYYDDYNTDFYPSKELIAKIIYDYKILSKSFCLSQREEPI